MGSPLIFVRDERTLPFVPVTLEALAAIAKAAPPKRLAYARSMYLALLEIAAEARASRVPITRRSLGERAGMSIDLVSDLATTLAEAGVVRVEKDFHGGQRIENTWVLTEPGVVADSHGGGGPQPRRTSLEEGLEEDSLRSSSTAARGEDGREKAKELKAKPGVRAVCDRLAERIRAFDPQAVTAEGRLEWLLQADKLIEQDGRHFEEIAAVMDWAFAGDFWPPLIHSMRYFRTKYPTLRGQWLKEQRRPAPGSYVNAAAAPAPIKAHDLVAAYDAARDPEAERRRRLGVKP